MKRKKLLTLFGVISIVLILVASLLMVAPASVRSAAASEGKTLKIGAIISMTGFASASEVLIWQGIQLF